MILSFVVGCFLSIRLYLSCSSTTSSGVDIITQGCDTFSILPWAKLFNPFQGYMMNHNINEIFSFTYIIST